MTANIVPIKARSKKNAGRQSDDEMPVEELLLYCERKGCSRVSVLLSSKARPNTKLEEIFAIIRDVIDIFHNHDNLTSLS